MDGMGYITKKNQDFGKLTSELYHPRLTRTQENIPQNLFHLEDSKNLNQRPPNFKQPSIGTWKKWSSQCNSRLTVEGLRNCWQGQVWSIDQHWYLETIDSCGLRWGTLEDIQLQADIWYEFKCRFETIFVEQICFRFFWLKNIRTTDGMLPVTFQSFRNCCKLDPGVYWVPLAMGNNCVGSTEPRKESMIGVCLPTVANKLGCPWYSVNGL